MENSDILDLLKEKYQALAGTLTRDEAKAKFVEIVKGYELMGINWFICKKVSHHDCETHDHVEDELPDRIYCGLKSSGLNLYDDNYTLAKTIEFKDMLKWGYSETSCVILYGDESEPKKLTLRTFQGFAIVHAITSFVDILLGKSPKPNLLVQANMRQTDRDSKFFKRVSPFKQHKPVTEN